MSAFKFYGVVLRGDEFTSGDANRNIIGRRVLRMGQVERAGTFLVQVGMCIFVEAVRGNALRGATQSMANRAQNYFMLPHGRRDDTAMAALARHGSTLGHFARMPGQAWRQSA